MWSLWTIFHYGKVLRSVTIILDPSSSNNNMYVRQLSKSEACMCWRKRERERKRVNLTWRVSYTVECVAVYFNLLQCGSDVWLNVLQCVWREGEKETSVYRVGCIFQCVAGCRSVLQWVAAYMYCSVLHCVAVRETSAYNSGGSVYCSAVQCAIWCCSVLQRVAAWLHLCRRLGTSINGPSGWRCVQNSAFFLTAVIERGLLMSRTRTTKTTVIDRWIYKYLCKTRKSTPFFSSRIWLAVNLSHFRNNLSQF